MEFWTLSKFGREYYQVEITTEPPITSWQISFDKGTSWHQMVYDTETKLCSVLVAGPFFTPAQGDGSQYVQILKSCSPYIRAIDDPEVIVRSTPRVDLV
jgi:hypothetical protein